MILSLLATFRETYFQNFKLFLSGFRKVLLSGIRALVEQQPADDDYTKYE